ncbi:MAG: thioredoxin family protein [Fimbriiglobus sp.]|jgi:hypothetical protein|nr:thioredoxin family protein [Fimbriiglobus sp.]
MAQPWSFVLVVLIALLSARVNSAADPKPAEKTPPELGRVPFLRDYPAAVEQAKKEKKPLFVLFDEVPG